jgi:hypothetical protein
MSPEHDVSIAAQSPFQQYDRAHEKVLLMRRDSRHLTLSDQDILWGILYGRGPVHGCVSLIAWGLTAFDKVWLEA